MSGDTFVDRIAKSWMFRKGEVWGRGEYSGDTLGTNEHDAKLLALADLRMRRISLRPLLAYGSHKGQDGACRSVPLSASLRPGLLYCQKCDEEFNRNNVLWHREAALVVALTEYELDDGNPAEAGRLLFEAVREHVNEAMLAADADFCAWARKHSE